MILRSFALGERHEYSHGPRIDGQTDRQSSLRRGRTRLDCPGGGPSRVRPQKVKLSAYSGAHFDRAYMADMLKDRRDGIAAFKREAAGGKSPEIKAFASKT